MRASEAKPACHLRAMRALAPPSLLALPAAQAAACSKAQHAGLRVPLRASGSGMHALSAHAARPAAAPAARTRLARRAPCAAALPRAAAAAAPVDELNPPRGDTRGAALLLEDVLLSVGSEDLLTSASLRIEPGECVGLVGSNGCGKSTLLRCVAGKRGVDGGFVAVPPGAPIGYLEQTATSGSGRTVAEEARSRMAATAAAAALATAEAAVASAGDGDAAAAAAALAAARDAYEAAGGAGAERRVASVLDGLGFTRAQWDSPCSTLSGGWQMRVALARLLLSPAGEGAAAGAAGGLLLLVRVRVVACAE
jgi:ABC-type branched-subunit amino acid transport system ATPase component